MNGTGAYILRLLLFSVLLLHMTAAPGFASNAVSHIVWQPFGQPESLKFSTIIGAVDTSLIYLRTEDGTLVVKNGQKWVNVPRHPDESVRSLVPYFGFDGRLYASLIDSAYYSASWIWTGDRWIDLKLTHDVPIRGYGQTPDGTLWAYGDWGSIFKRHASRSWQRVTSPSEQHITRLLVVSNDEFWIGTRADGAFHVKGDTIVHYPLPGGAVADVLQLSMLHDGRVVIGDEIGRQYYADDGRLFDLKPLEGEEEWSWVKSIVSGEEVYVHDDLIRMVHEGRDETIAYLDERIGSVSFLADGTLLGLDGQGWLYHGSARAGLFFHDATNRYRVAGYQSDQTLAALFRDVTSDHAVDMLQLVSEPIPGTHLYEGNQGGAFLEITRESGIGNSGPNQHALIGDLDRDGRPDLIFGSMDAAGFVLQTYLNRQTGRFLQSQYIDQRAVKTENPTSLQLVDIDADGDLDLLEVDYYGPREDRRGGVTLFRNRGSGRLHPEPEWGEELVAFNRSATFADFNLDGRLDFFLSTRWLADRLQLGTASGFERADTSFFPDGMGKSNREGALAIDLDGDGDQDIFLINMQDSPQVWLNDGSARFTDATETWFRQLDDLFEGGLIFSAVAGDMDLDGRVDILLTVRRVNSSHALLLLNRGTHFQSAPLPLGLEKASPFMALPLDIDYDGDLDVYMVEERRNSLYLNRIAGKKSLVIAPRGRRSNPDGLHARVDVFGSTTDGGSYQRLNTGWIGGASFVRHPFAAQLPNEIVFGGLKKDQVDVRIAFLGGATAWYRNVEVGTRVELVEPYTLSSLGYPWVGRIVNLLRQRSVQYFAFAFLISSLMMLFVVVLGRKKLSWGITWAAALVLINQSAFWILAILSASHDTYMRFVAPVGFVLFGTALPYLFSYSLKRKRLSYLEKTSDELLNHLLVFNHGEWAMNNLNSLRRLLPHYVMQGSGDMEQLYEQCQQRIMTWRELTRPNLLRLIEMGKALEMQATLLLKLEEDVQQLHRVTQQVMRSGVSSPLELDPDPIVQYVEGIQTTLRSLKQQVFQGYSCDAARVLGNLTSSMKEQFEKQGVRLELPDLTTAFWVLIPSYELAGILDNSLNNALRALNGVDEPYLRLTFASLGAKSQISIQDNGQGIDPGHQEAIFLEGVSSTGGGGHGLAQAREILKHYGGGIHLVRSEPGAGTEFRIDLNEGVKRNESDPADH